MWVALAGSRPPTFVADYIRNVIKPQLQTVPGVGEVQLWGFRERNVRVWFDAERLEAQGLTVADVNARHPARARRGARGPHREPRSAR